MSSSALAVEVVVAILSSVGLAAAAAAAEYCNQRFTSAPMQR
jgi:hypothetical protein